MHLTGAEAALVMDLDHKWSTYKGGVTNQGKTTLASSCADLSAVGASLHPRDLRFVPSLTNLYAPAGTPDLQRRGVCDRDGDRDAAQHGRVRIS